MRLEETPIKPWERFFYSLQWQNSTRKQRRDNKYWSCMHLSEHSFPTIFSCWNTAPYSFNKKQANSLIWNKRLFLFCVICHQAPEWVIKHTTTWYLKSSFPEALYTLPDPAYRATQAALMETFRACQSSFLAPTTEIKTSWEQLRLSWGFSFSQLLKSTIHV